MEKLAKTILYFLIFLPLLSFAETTTVAQNGMVVSEQQIASEIGANILKQGGNAIDAAVATGYALAVTYPCCGNIGGGGFMTIHLANGKNIFLNFRETAPSAATPDMYLNKEPNATTQGYLAVAVPGTVLGFDTALKQYGTMSRQVVMAPAIVLAEHGFVFGKKNAKLLAENSTQLTTQNNVKKIFFKNNQLLTANDILLQPDLGNTLKLISEYGPDVFYKGSIAKSIVTASEANGGILELKDFSNYTVTEEQPIVCSYHGYTIISAPPPSSGGITLCEALNILSGYPLKNLGFHSAASIHYLAEAMRFAFIDRNNKLGDPDFVNNPIQELLSLDYAAQIRQKIPANKSSEPIQTPMPKEGVNTTHYSIVDKYGNAVAVTYTINNYFGAGVIAGNTGFFLNDEMDDFATQPGKANAFGLVQGTVNAIQPGKRPLSSMSPTIILKNGKVVMVLGSHGGPRIITSVLQTIINVLDYGMNIQQAVNAPRIHQQGLPNIIYFEPFAISQVTQKELNAMGYQLTEDNPWSGVEAIYIDQNSKQLFGANDYRSSDGKAVGY